MKKTQGHKRLAHPQFFKVSGFSGQGREFPSRVKTSPVIVSSKPLPWP
ncbi:MAG: hypothetical protein HY036_01965 [Nitrospirae bacterium]|nr:hypothetical protein [Nitrospirota bacterium]MBI3351323.1 hypothetical protein [Nitrospirota bacterium]